MTDVAAPARAKTRPLPVGTLIDRMWALREERKALEAQAAAKEKELDDLEATLMAQMDAEGIKKATGSKATVSFTTSVVAQIQGDEGWAQFHAYIKKTGHFGLLQKRVTDTAFRELLLSINNKQADTDVDYFKLKKQIPGSLPFTKKRINLRTLSA
jgi:hypothetical protein